MLGSGILWFGWLGYDDSLDVVAVHGIGGLTGLLLTGLFATTGVNAHGANGLFYGGASVNCGGRRSRRWRRSPTR